MKKPAEISVKAAERLAVLLQLERMARRCREYKAFCFFAVNETVRLFPYDRAVFWRFEDGKALMESVSGVPVLDDGAPFSDFMKRAVSEGAAKEGNGRVRLLEASDFSPSLASRWGEFNSEKILWLPFVSPVTRRVEAGLWLTRKSPVFEDAETGLAELLSESYADIFYAWKSSGSVPAVKKVSGRKKAVAALALAVCALFPVRMSAVAPAEVVPENPFLITAPMSGVIKSVAVKAGQSVKAGDVLFSFDDADLRNRLRLADKALAAAGEEYKKAAQLSFSSADSKARLPLIRLEMEKAKDERAYLSELASRSVVRSGVSGTAVFSDASELAGRPVSLGEKIMTLADPQKTSLKILLPVQDAIDVSVGSDVGFFMYAMPEKARKATVSFVSYEAEPVPEGFLAYRVKADFKEQAPYRIGTRGIAKIYGRRVPFAYYALRRPLSALRRWFGI